MQVTDCLVIGGGIAALYVAHELTKLKINCSLMKPSAHTGGASQAGAGILSALPPPHQNPKIQASIERSLKLWPDLLKQMKMSNLWQRAQLQVLKHPLTNLEQLNKLCAKQKVKNVRIIDNVPLMLCKLEQYIGRQVDLISGAATSISYVDNSARANFAISYRNEKMHSCRIVAKTVVLAAGIWSNRIKFEGCSLLPRLSALRGYVLEGTISKNSLADTIAAKLPIRQIVLNTSEQQPLYVIFGEGNRILLGGFLQERKQIRKAVCKQKIKLMQERLSEFAILPSNFTLTKVRSGYRPCLSDQRANPLVFEHPQVSRLFVCTGHCRYGLSMAPDAGQKIAKLVNFYI